jgi:hypothetical protein
MKFTFLPIWTGDRATVTVGPSNTMLFPMPGKSEDYTPVLMTLRPFGMPMTQAVEWWWRVKTWILQATFSDIGPVEITMGRTSGSEEKQLCRPESYTWTGTYDATSGPQVRVLSAELVFLPPEGTYLFGTAAPDFGPTGDPYSLPESTSIPSARTIYPTVALRIYTDPMWDIGTEITGAAASIPLIIPAGPDYSEHDGTIDGIAWRLGWDGDVAMASITWTLTPLQWYPWADTDGSNPTWNATTGERII